MYIYVCVCVCVFLHTMFYSASLISMAMFQNPIKNKNPNIKY